MTRAVLMVGGGVQQVDAVHLARSAGYRVIVSDRNADAPAFAAADERWVVDGADHAELVRRALGTPDLAGVFTLTELVEAVAAVAQAASLPGASLDAARACQDKSASRARWTEADVPIARGGSVRDAREAHALYGEIGPDVFVKPARGFGGRGSGRVANPDDLGGAITRALEIAPIVVMEEFLEGTHHDVNAVFDGNGTLHAAGLADRTFAPGRPVELGASSPTALEPAEREQMLGIVARAARALGITLGPVKADLIRTDDGLRLLEMAPRLHGPKGSLGLVPAAEGFEPLLGALRVLTGQPIGDTLTPTRARAATYGALQAAPGVVTSIEGVDDALALPGVERIWTFVAPGDRVRSAESSTGVPGYALASGTDPAEARARMNAARSRVRIVTEPDRPAHHDLG